jgi:hypothetical protein
MMNGSTISRERKILPNPPKVGLVGTPLFGGVVLADPIGWQDGL